MKWFDRTGFQGARRRTGYFEGWYYKNVSAGGDAVFSFIPGISLDAGDPHAFIQVINGITGKTSYVRYPVDAFSCNPGELSITLGSSVFTRHHGLVFVHPVHGVQSRSRIRGPRNCRLHNG